MKSEIRVILRQESVGIEFRRFRIVSFIEEIARLLHVLDIPGFRRWGGRLSGKPCASKQDKEGGQEGASEGKSAIHKERAARR